MRSLLRNEVIIELKCYCGDETGILVMPSNNKANQFIDAYICPKCKKHSILLHRHSYIFRRKKDCIEYNKTVNKWNKAHYWDEVKPI